MADCPISSFGFRLLKKIHALKQDYIHVGDTLLLPTANLMNLALVRQEEEIIHQKKKTYKIIVEVHRSILRRKIEEFI